MPVQSELDRRNQSFDRPGLTNTEHRALVSGNGDPQHTGSLLSICSEVFAHFYMSLKSDPQSYIARIPDEVRAEAFRLWSLQLVRVQTVKQIEAVDAELKRRFFDTSSATGPFSATAIYGEVGLSKMIDAHASAKKSSRGGPPGPAELLRMPDGVPDRERKELQQRTLKAVCAKFAASGLDF